jgi:hypothetical protein
MWGVSHYEECLVGPGQDDLSSPESEPKSLSSLLLCQCLCPVGGGGGDGGGSGLLPSFQGKGIGGTLH